MHRSGVLFLHPGLEIRRPDIPALHVKNLWDQRNRWLGGVFPDILLHACPNACLFLLTRQPGFFSVWSTNFLEPSKPHVLYGWFAQGLVFVGLLTSANWEDYIIQRDVHQALEKRRCDMRNDDVLFASHVRNSQNAKFDGVKNDDFGIDKSSNTPSLYKICDTM